MRFAFSFLVFLCLSSPTYGDQDPASLYDDWGWSTLDVRMPKPMSDHTASLAANGMVYLAGGCDSDKGNEWVPIDEKDGFFACGSISDEFLVFDPVDREFESLGKLPRPRYRHSSAIVNNQLWLTGGRTVSDEVIPQVDVYDIDSKQWSVATLPEEYRVSDHASFAIEPDHVYIVGGYNVNYTAQSMVNRILVTSLTNSTLQIDEQAALNTPRGDITCAVAADGEAAYVTGGFTHENNFCAPLGSTEEFSVAENVWNQRASLVNARGELVLVELNNDLYALGGERQIEDICDYTGDADPGELTVATEEVEVFDKTADKWYVINSFPVEKFRFAAVAVDTDLDDSDAIYAFGGQTAYDSSCGCFKTTDTVSVFGKNLSSGGALSVSVFSMVLGFFISATLVL